MRSHITGHILIVSRDIHFFSKAKERKLDGRSNIHDKVRRLQTPTFLNTLTGLMQEGAFSKAVKHLLSDGIYDAKDAYVRERLSQLHPPPLPKCPPITSRWKWTDDDSGERELLFQVRRIVLDFPAGSGGGPSGLKPSHLQDIVREDDGTGASLVTSLSSFLKFCVDGHLSPEAAQYMCSANLIPLRKASNPCDVRPVAVGETLRRFVAKFVMNSTQAKQAIAALAPSQCGVATPGATETVAMALQNWVNNSIEESSWKILQVDLKNAFNTISREALLNEVAVVAPDLFAWASTCYAQHSFLFAQGHVLSSEQGVQQGDPLGPLFFALTWQRVVRTLPEGLSINSWYLDDGHLVGDPSTLDAALRCIEVEGAALGVTLNVQKCKIWGPGSVAQVPTENSLH